MIINLVSDTVCLFGGVLELLDDGVQLVRLVLQRLHLLPDGVHGRGGEELSEKLSLTGRVSRQRKIVVLCSSKIELDILLNMVFGCSVD